jgi:hypothetical protein
MRASIQFMHGISTAIGSLASIACYATSLHGASTWLPSFQGFNGIEVLTMTVTMTWIIVCGCFPAVKAAYTLISISRKEMGSLPLQFGWSLLGFGVLTMLHVVEGEAEAAHRGDQWHPLSSKRSLLLRMCNSADLGHSNMRVRPSSCEA